MPETSTKTVAPKTTGQNSYKILVRSYRDLANYTHRVFTNETIQANDISEAQKVANKAKDAALAVQNPDFDTVIIKIYEAVGEPEPKPYTDFRLAFSEEVPVKKSKK